jgi:PAS domain S-box-containing protein
MYEDSIVTNVDKNVQELNLYKQIFTYSKDAIAIFDPRGFYIEQNPAHRALLGYSDEELSGKTPEIHLGEEVFSSIFRTLSQENIYRGELYSITKEGREIHIDLSAFSVKDKQQNVIFYVGINSLIPLKRDTEDKAMEEKTTEEIEISSSLLQIFETLNSSLDEKQLLNNVMSIIPDYLKFSRVAILMHDHDLSTYASVASHGFNPTEESILLSKSFSDSEIPALKRLEKGGPLWVSKSRDCSDMSSEFVDAFNIESAILVPIVVGRKVRGVMLGEYTKDSPKEVQDRNLLKVIANSMGTAVHKCRLYKESTERLIDLKNRIETIKVKSHIDREILSALDRDTVLNSAIAMIGKVIPCDRVSVLLKEQSIYRVIAEWGLGYPWIKTTLNIVNILWIAAFSHPSLFPSSSKEQPLALLTSVHKLLQSFQQFTSQQQKELLHK